MKKWLILTAIAVLTIQSLLLLAGVFCRRPGVDEAWIAEWCYFESTEGHARSELFSGYCLYGERVVLIHRLFVLLASGVITIAGFHLWVLRLTVVLLSAVLLFLVCRFLKRSGCSRGVTLAGAALLLMFPLFWRGAGFFRPEIMNVLFGFGSFVCLQAPGEGDWLRKMFAGILAGLALTTHVAGLCFVASGAVLLLWEKRPRDLFPYLGGVVIPVFPWLVEIVLNYDLYLLQASGEMVKAKTAFTLATPFLNLLEEHQRLFRNPEAITASALIVASLLTTSGESYRKHSAVYRYFAVAALVLGLASSTKTVTYTVLLLPFGAVCSALALDDWIRGATLKLWPRIRRGMLTVCILTTVVMGFRESIGTVSSGRYIPEEVNGQAGELIPEGNRCLAPIHFVFGQIHRLRIGSLYLWRTLSRDEEALTMNSLFEYAAARNTRYIVLDGYWISRIEDCHQFLDSPPGDVNVTDTGELVLLEW